MGTVAKVLSTIRRFKGIRRNSCWQQDFLYPLLFQDDLYGIAYNQFISESSHRRKKISGLSCGSNFLTLKRLMEESRQSKISWIGSGKSIKKFRIAQKIVAIVFNLTFSTRSKSSMKTMNEWSSYQSIHSVFPFMEDGIRNSNSYLNFVVPYCVHPEKLIRMFRRRISDTSFLHFMRLSLHRYDKTIISYPPTTSINQEFYHFIWTYYIHEFEYSLINMFKRIYCFRSTPLRSFIDRTNLIHKMECFLGGSNRKTGENFARRNNSIHYVRYRNNLVITMDASTKSLIDNWKVLLTIFWERYWRSWTEPHRISVKNSFKNPLLFLGCIPRTKKGFVVAQTQLVNRSIDTDLITREFCSIVPILPLIVSLSREGFCSASGHPICRVSWTTLADNEIFERFDRVTRSIFCYYGGSTEKKGLYQFRYILRFSCAKTLACKHKSTIRTVWKKYGSILAVDSVPFNRATKSLFPNHWRINPHGRKFWYLNITRINYLSNLLQELKNVQDSWG
uniref:maturase K n=1 Tax=Fossombronia foveolata TaxID=56918 RepID=UPI00257962CD|nr:maturase K [Fossombronia foveolata]WIA67205.1 maturase K [Fossombronia foveolata]